MNQTPAPPAELLVAARFDVGPGYVVHRGRGAPNWLVTWTFAGAGRIQQGGVDVIAQPGDLVVLGPDLPHSYTVAPGASGWSFWWVHCPPRASWRSWLSPHDLGDRVFRAGVPAHLHPRVSQAFRALHADARWSGHGPPPDPVPAGEARARPAVAVGTAARELALGRVEEVLLLATAASGTALGSPSGRGLDPRVRRVEALLLADPAAPHTVRSLAAQVALSPSRLSHLFSEQTGTTLMRALRDARLRYAARLLEGTDLPVRSVATASGFVSAFHFSRLFRARFGVPPKEYRAGARQPAEAIGSKRENLEALEG
jgi:AraC family transcriptional regulator of arabinose operon